MKENITNLDIFNYLYAINTHKLENEVFFREYLKDYIKYFSQCSNVLVLDSTYGTFLQLLNEQNINSVGLENNNYFIEKSKENKINLTYTDSYENYLLENKNKFDGIFIPYILEKFENGLDALKFLITIEESLKENAKIVLLLENFTETEVHGNNFWDNLENNRTYPVELIEIIASKLNLDVLDKVLVNNKKEFCIVLKKNREQNYTETILERIETVFNKVMNELNTDDSFNKNVAQFYLQYFQGCKKVLDLASGKGYFLEILKENNISAMGIDISQEKINICQEKNLNAIHSDYKKFLNNTNDEFDGIFCSHFVEHLDKKDLIELLYLFSKKIKYGGIVTIVTPNFGFFPVHEKLFWTDLTHKKPCHVSPILEILKFLGFEYIVNGFSAGDLDMFVVAKKVAEPFFLESSYSSKEKYLDEIFKISSHFFEGDFEFRQNYQRTYLRFFDICLNVLVLPCRDGVFMELLKQSDIDSEGVEEFKYAFEVAEKNGFKVSNKNAFDFLETKNEEYEGIFSPHYIDHISSKEVIKFLQLCYKALKPNGNIVIVFPNFSHHGVHESLFWADISHTRPYTIKTIKRIMEEIGFRIISEGTEANGLDNFISAYKPFIYS